MARWLVWLLSFVRGHLSRRSFWRGRLPLIGIWVACGLLIFFAISPFSNIPGLGSILRKPQILQTWEQQRANKPAWEAQEEGDKAYRTGDFEGAQRHFSRAIELYGEESRAAGWSYRNRAAVRQRLGKKQEALADYGKAIALEPEYVLGYTARARLLTDLGRHDEAMADYATALKQEPRSGSTLVARGQLLEKMGQHDRAGADFVQAIAFARSEYDPMIERAKEDRDRKFWTRVRDEIIVDAHVGRGNVFRSQNRSDEALAEYGKAIELGPNTRFIYVSRGWLYEKQGRLEPARADYEKAASLGTPSDWLKRALERMR
jgi:tetratricopeptide (TPR) repeat protein